MKDYIPYQSFLLLILFLPGFQVYAQFELSAERLAEIRQQADNKQKCQPVFEIQIKDSQGELIAEVVKTLSVKRK